MHYINYKKFIFTLLIIITPLMFVNSQRKGLEESFLFQLSSNIIGFIKLQYFQFSNSITDTVSQYTLILEVKKKNLHLDEENKKLHIQQMQMTDLRMENQRLKQMLKFNQNSSLNLLASKVISMDPFPDYNLLQINKGSKNGIKKHMLAIVESGVVGYIVRIQKHTSSILLLSDRNAVIPVTIERSRVSGLISGLNKSLYKLNYLRNEDDVRKGDLVITSLINQNLPAGLFVGTVSKVIKNEYDLSQEVDIIPAVDFSKIEELFIILN